MKQQEEQQVIATQSNICEMVRLWSSQSKKAKKHSKWNHFYAFLIKCIFPQIKFDQILVQNQAEQLQQIRFLISSNFTFVYQNLYNGYQIKSTDAILVLNRDLQLITYEKSQIKSIEKLEKLSMTNNYLKSEVACQEKYFVYCKQTVNCSFLKGDKKIIQKFKNDLFKLDRVCKEKFLSEYLFGGYSPQYCLKSLRINKLVQRQSFTTNTNHIYIIFSGVVRMKVNIIQSQYNFIDLNKGAFLQNSRLSQLVNKFQVIKDYSSALSFKPSTNCTLILMEKNQFQKILNQNNKIKQFFLRQYKNVWLFRVKLTNKIHISLQNIQSSKLKSEPKTYYSLVRKNHSQKSFRVKRNLSDFQCENLMTIGIYDEIIKNKEQIVIKKKQYRQRLIDSSQQTQSLSTSRVYLNIKKNKQIMKNLKIQNFKIQKIALKLQVENIQSLSKKMNFVEGIFQDNILKGQNICKKQNQQKLGIQRQKNKVSGRKVIRTKSVLPEFFRLTSRDNLIKKGIQGQVLFKNNLITQNSADLKNRINGTPFNSILNIDNQNHFVKKKKQLHRKTAKY